MATPANHPAEEKRSIRAQTRAVLLLALILRLLVFCVVAATYPADWLYNRGTEMAFLARSVVAGLGLSSPFGVPTGPTAFIAPGYPLLVALVFRIFGVYSHTSAMVIILCQVVLNVATIWLMMHVARKIFDQRTAFVAGLIWACSLPLLWLPTILWDTCISLFAIMALFVLALHSRQSAGRGLWVLLGALCAITALINPALLLVLFSVLGWAAFESRPRRATNLLLAVVTFLVLFSPWPLRNERVFHAFVPLRTTVGMELWMGNRPGSTGFLDESIFPTFNHQELDSYKRMGEIAYTDRKAQLAKSYIRDHKAVFASLTARRILRFWLGTGTRGGSLTFVLQATFTSIFGLAGLWLLFHKKRWREGVLFLLPLLLFPLPYYITHAEFRYRVVIDPLLTILAAYALVTIARWWMGHQQRQPSHASGLTPSP